MGGGCGARKMRGTRTAPLGPWPLRTVSITRHGYEGGERETRDTPTVDSMCARRSVPALCKLYGGCLQRMPAADACSGCLQRMPGTWTSAQQCAGGGARVTLSHGLSGTGHREGWEATIRVRGLLWLTVCRESRSGLEVCSVN